MTGSVLVDLGAGWLTTLVDGGHHFVAASENSAGHAAGDHFVRRDSDLSAVDLSEKILDAGWALLPVVAALVWVVLA